MGSLQPAFQLFHLVAVQSVGLRCRGFRFQGPVNGQGETEGGMAWGRALRIIEALPGLKQATITAQRVSFGRDEVGCVQRVGRWFDQHLCHRLLAELLAQQVEPLLHGRAGWQRVARRSSRLLQLIKRC